MLINTHAALDLHRMGREERIAFVTQQRLANQVAAANRRGSAVGVARSAVGGWLVALGLALRGAGAGEPLAPGATPADGGLVVG